MLNSHLLEKDFDLIKSWLSIFIHPNILPGSSRIVRHILVLLPTISNVRWTRIHIRRTHRLSFGQYDLGLTIVDKRFET